MLTLRRSADPSAASDRTFASRSAVVTGGASGIGLAIARDLARGGAVVTLADVDVERAEVHARALREQGAKAEAVEIDVTDRGAVDDLLRRVADEHGRLDLMFNNAGVGGTLPFEEATAQQWDRILALNLRSVIDGTDAAYRLMRAQGGGHIVNTASIAGLVPVPMQTLYNTTKFGVVGLSTTLRPEAAAHGVRVSVVCPGQVATAIWGTPILGERDLSAPAPPQAVSAERAAAAVLRGVRRNQAVITFPTPARRLALAYRYAPWAMSRWLGAEHARRAG
ncbi:short-chain dehydrogenase [Cellulomonas soli]|uniref:Short-chain dehydrogenase n=1 Tax=Cellulomonas soli TaxID=931535 RepID=A0A512PGK7_9CELL|nr:short-chain dehydrogenase [Cellulomonas soli]